MQTTSVRKIRSHCQCSQSKAEKVILLTNGMREKMAGIIVKFETNSHRLTVEIQEIVIFCDQNIKKLSFNINSQTADLVFNLYEKGSYFVSNINFVIEIYI